jgi:hypothetical protein
VPDDARARQRTGTGIGLLLALVLGAVRAHPALSGDGRLVLSCDVNWLETTGAQANLSRNVSLYRPRFVTVRLGPVH